MIKTFFCSNNLKWLSWESRKKDVKIRNALRGNLCDIAKWSFTEISLVGFSGVGIPFRGKNTFTTNSFKSYADAANSCK